MTCKILKIQKWGGQPNSKHALVLDQKDRDNVTNGDVIVEKACGPNTTPLSGRFRFFSTARPYRSRSF